MDLKAIWASVLASKGYDVAKKGIRAGVAAAVGIWVASLMQDPKYGAAAALVWGVVGKLLREKWPNVFGALPVL